MNQTVVADDRPPLFLSNVGHICFFSSIRNRTSSQSFGRQSKHFQVWSSTSIQTVCAIIVLSDLSFSVFQAFPFPSQILYFSLHKDLEVRLWSCSFSPCPTVLSGDWFQRQTLELLRLLFSPAVTLFRNIMIPHVLAVFHLVLLLEDSLSLSLCTTLPKPTVCFSYECPFVQTSSSPLPSLHLSDLSLSSCPRSVTPLAPTQALTQCNNTSPVYWADWSHDSQRLFRDQSEDVKQEVDQGFYGPNFWTVWCEYVHLILWLTDGGPGPSWHHYRLRQTGLAPVFTKVLHPRSQQRDRSETGRTVFRLQLLRRCQFWGAPG